MASCWKSQEVVLTPFIYPQRYANQSKMWAKGMSYMESQGVELSGEQGMPTSSTSICLSRTCASRHDMIAFFPI